MADNHPECPGYGFCDSSRKQIIITPGCPSLDATMIHEIAHAVAQQGHGLKWQQRMEKAAQKADSIGCKELAAAIREDYTAYSDPDRCWIIPAIAVYKQIEDAVFETCGEHSFEEIVDFVANSVSLASSQLLTKYKKVRTVYEKAHQKEEERRRRSAKIPITSSFASPSSI